MLLAWLLPGFATTTSFELHGEGGHRRFVGHRATTLTTTVAVASTSWRRQQHSHTASGRPTPTTQKTKKASPVKSYPGTTPSRRRLAGRKKVTTVERRCRSRRQWLVPQSLFCWPSPELLPAGAAAVAVLVLVLLGAAATSAALAAASLALRARNLSPLPPLCCVTAHAHRPQRRHVSMPPAQAHPPRANRETPPQPFPGEQPRTHHGCLWRRRRRRPVLGQAVAARRAGRALNHLDVHHVTLAAAAARAHVLACAHAPKGQGQGHAPPSGKAPDRSGAVVAAAPARRKGAKARGERSPVTFLTFSSFGEM